MSEWVCQQCTLANEPDARTCEICGAPRPGAASSRHSEMDHPRAARSHSSRVPLSSGKARSSRAHMAELDSDEDYRPPENDPYEDLENASSPSTPGGGDVNASLLSRSGVPPAGHGRNTAPWVTGPPSLPPSPPKIVKALGGENGQGQYSQVSMEEVPGEAQAVKPEEGTARRPCDRFLCCFFCLACLLLPLAAFYLLRHNKGLAEEVAERGASAEKAVWSIFRAKERDAGASRTFALPAASGGRSGHVLIVASETTTATTTVTATTALAATTTTVTSLPFDCMAGYANWEAGWSTQKKSWCCWFQQRGCQTTAAIGTTRTTSTLPASTSTLTTTVVITTTFLPYTCDVVEADPQTWMPGKQAWCCLHHDLGCPTHELPYDCHEGFENWVEQWSYGRRAWCCLVSQRACGDAPPPTRASPVVTTTRSVGRHARQPDRGCDALCEHKGWSASCRTRIQYAAIHEFLWKPSACVRAYKKVLGECDTCSECVHSDTGCGTPAPPESMRRSMESTSTAASTTRPSEVSAASTTTPLHFTTRPSEVSTASTTTPLPLESSAPVASPSSSEVVDARLRRHHGRGRHQHGRHYWRGRNSTTTGAAASPPSPTVALAAAAAALDGGAVAPNSTASSTVQPFATTLSIAGLVATTSTTPTSSSTASPTVQPVAVTTSVADLVGTTSVTATTSVADLVGTTSVTATTSVADLVGTTSVTATTSVAPSSTASPTVPPAVEKEEPNGKGEAEKKDDQKGRKKRRRHRAHMLASKYPPAERCLDLPERLLYCRSQGGNKWPLCMGIKDGDTAEGLAKGVIELQDCGAGDASRYEQFVLNHTDSQIHWYPDPSKCLEVETRNGEVPEGAKVKLADCQEPCEVMRDPTRQGFCMDVTQGAHKALKSSCYGYTSDKNPAEFDTNRETAHTKCMEVAGGDASKGAPVTVRSCNEQEFNGGSQCWLYIDMYRKCPACDRKPVPAFMNLANNMLPSGGTDCMPTNFPGSCSADRFESCGRSCCCDGHQWTCATDSFTCGCWRPLLECSEVEASATLTTTAAALAPPVLAPPVLAPPVLAPPVLAPPVLAPSIATSTTAQEPQAAEAHAE